MIATPLEATTPVNHKDRLTQWLKRIQCLYPKGLKHHRPLEVRLLIYISIYNKNRTHV